MTRSILSLFAIFLLVAGGAAVARGQQAKSLQGASQLADNQTPANTTGMPGQILRSGASLTSEEFSANGQQLAKQLQLTASFYKLQDLKARIRAAGETSQEGWQSRLELLETKELICEKLQKAQMEVDYLLAEVSDEQNIYNELLSAFTASRDKTIAVTNAVSFLTNGALWAIGEALAIPTWSRPKYSISSGTVSVLAGVIPSLASGYTLRAIYGHHYTAPASPNILAKLFDRPTSTDIDYPATVWDFLNVVPAGDNTGKTRREQIIDRWVSDKHIPSFTDRNAKAQIDRATASVDQKRTLTIAVLTERLTMLDQLSTEVFKMDRLLLELMMVVTGEKHI